ncbi:hypothetical protein ACFQZ4_17585 [Catellatospora coxensis]
MLASSGTASAILDLPHRLIEEALAADPVDVAPWTPGEPAPVHLRGVLGRWWGEGYEYVFRWEGGVLTGRGADDPADAPRPSSRRCPASRTCCVPCRAGRWASACG